MPVIFIFSTQIWFWHEQEMRMYIGVDVGGTNTRIGLFPGLDAPDFTSLVHFPTVQDYDQQRDAIIAAIKQVSSATVQGVGISIGGRMARDGRSVLVAPNLPGYVGRPLVQQLEAALGCPVRLAHDTVCGLLAEKMFGVLQAGTRCAYLTLSTGTGAAVYFSQESTSNTFSEISQQTGLFLSIEIGHQILDGNELVCLCGQVGCLETETGGRQLELRGYPTDQFRDEAFWQHFCMKLAVGIVNLVQLTRVETIAVSGAIMLHQPFLLPLLQQSVNDRLRGSTLTLRIATLRENAPLVGAATLLKIPKETILH
jgi:glucokinase